MKIEIAVQDYSGAKIAKDEKANRIELCVGLPLGGLTPTTGLAKRVAEIGIETHALIRPRPGDFIYSDDEVQTMTENIKELSKYCEGFVIGALNPDSTVDVAALKALISAAGNKELTFHRAFDQVKDPETAATELKELGFARILTSGGCNSAIEGKNNLAKLKATVSGIQVMAGGGIKINDIKPLMEAGVDAIHLSAKTTKQSTAVGDNVTLGSADAGDTSYDVTDPKAVAEAVTQVHSN
ncbi:MAG: copper homeostasis protein CutC [Micrococcaceae bacterium]